MVEMYKIGYAPPYSVLSNLPGAAEPGHTEPFHPHIRHAGEGFAAWHRVFPREI
jgi:hypothetical protein